MSDYTRMCRNCHKMAYPGKKYCSKECAQSYSKSREESLNAAAMEKSGSKTGGDHSEVISIASKKIERDHVGNIIKTENQLTENEPKEEETKTMNTEKTGTVGTDSTEKSTMPMRTEENEKEILQGQFGQALASISGESFLKTNLIDESVKHLHGLMKSVGIEMAPEKRHSAHTIKAVCSCASEIRGLLKLKLDIVKEAREWGK